MAESAFAWEKAQEIFKSALENKALNKWQSDLRRISGLVKDDTLLKLLESQDRSLDEKSTALAERLVEASPEAITLVSELIAKKRLPEIEEISDEYQRLLDNHLGIEGAETAHITTAIELDEEYVLKLAKRLTDLFGRPVVVKTRVNPDIVGGIIIRVGDKLIDGSISSKLEALKRDIQGAIR